MRLSVLHRTRYRFDPAATRLIQSHRLTPSVFAGQTAESWSVTVPGAQTGPGFRDGAGDWIGTVSLPGPVEEVEIVVEGIVETTDLAGVLRDHKEVMPPEVYRRGTNQTHVSPSIRDLSRTALMGLDGASTLDRAHALSRAVSEAMAFRDDATTARTTAEDALGKGAGVCQDYAHILIAAARAVGLPARYVIGYLRTGEEVASHEAAHAWAEIHVAGLGWVGFDPSNECCPDDRYIRLGSGLDAPDAAPIRGIAGGVGEETLDVTVEVGAAQQ